MKIMARWGRCLATPSTYSRVVGPEWLTVVGALLLCIVSNSGKTFQSVEDNFTPSFCD